MAELFLQVEVVFPDGTMDVVTVSSRQTIAGLKRQITQRPSYNTTVFRYLSQHDFDVAMNEQELMSVEFTKFYQSHPLVKRAFDSQQQTLRVQLIPKEMFKHRVAKISPTAPAASSPATSSKDPPIIIAKTRAATQSVLQTNGTHSIIVSTPSSGASLSVSPENKNTTINNSSASPRSPAPQRPAPQVSTTPDHFQRERSPFRPLPPHFAPIVGTPFTRGTIQRQPVGEESPVTQITSHRRRSRSVGDLTALVPKLNEKGVLVEGNEKAVVSNRPSIATPTPAPAPAPTPAPTPTSKHTHSSISPRALSPPPISPRAFSPPTLLSSASLDNISITRKHSNPPMNASEAVEPFSRNLSVKIQWEQKSSRLTQSGPIPTEDLMISCNFTSQSTTAHLRLEIIDKLKKVLNLLSAGELSLQTEFRDSKINMNASLLDIPYISTCLEKNTPPQFVIIPSAKSPIVSPPSTPRAPTPTPQPGFQNVAANSNSLPPTATPPVSLASRSAQSEELSLPASPNHAPTKILRANTDSFSLGAPAQSSVLLPSPLTERQQSIPPASPLSPNQSPSNKVVIRQQATKPNSSGVGPASHGSERNIPTLTFGKKTPFSTLKLSSDKTRPTMQAMFQKTMTRKIVEKEEVTDFRTSAQECIEVWKAKTKPSMKVTNTRVTDSPYPTFLSTNITVLFLLPKSSICKPVNCRVDQTVSEVLRELMLQTPAQLLAKNTTEDSYVVRICGLCEYLHPSQTLGSILYVRDNSRAKKPIVFALVEKQNIDEEYSSVVVPNDQFSGRLDFNDISSSLVVAKPKYFKNTEQLIDASRIEQSLRFKIVSLSNLYIHYPALEDIQDALYFVEVGIYHAGQSLLPQPMRTLQTANQIWGFWMECPLRICDLPPATRLCITVYTRRKSSREDAPIGWVNLQLFNYKGLLCVGSQNLGLWIGARGNPIGTCSQNLENPMPLLLTLEFPTFEGPICYSTPPIWTIPNCPIVQGIEPPEPLRSTLESIISKDTLYRLSADEKHLLWNHRNYLRKFPKALPKVLMCVDWTDPLFFAEAIRMLPLWSRPSAVDALELLEWKYAAPEVREYAVGCLSTMGDRELSNYLLQLVQVLKYEPYHDSPLARFLLQRALGNRSMIGHALFWNLQSEMHVPYISERYGLLLEAYLQSCDKEQNEDLIFQQNFVGQLFEIAIQIKQVSGRKNREKALRDKLSSLSLPYGFRLPVNSNVLVKGLVVEKCKLLDSATLPIWLEFDISDPHTDPFRVIFKAGDDLRQDVLVLQMFEIMNRLWQAEGLDVILTPYRCISTGDGVGMIQVVPDSVTVAKIQKEDSGVTAALMKTPLTNWLRDKNPKDVDYEAAVENFVSSCAGYCVATYVLGIGDRHNDNIMVTKSGFLFHIDFSKFLGNVEKWQGIKRERAPFVFTPEFAYVMGGKGSPQFEKFVQLGCDAYLVLRKHSHLFINLFSMMLSTGLPELNKDEDINYLRNAFALDQTESQASETFKDLIFESMKTKATQINFLIHNLAHMTT